MSGFELPDFGRMMIPDQSLVESFLRGVLVYFALLFLFRTSMNRQAGGVALTDLMLVVLVSECVSVSLSTEAKSIPNGLAAVCGLMGSNLLVDWASYRWKWARRLVSAEPVQVVRDGHPIRENMAKENITEEELRAKLREEGIDDVARVKAAFIEAEGNVSVVPADEGAGPTPQDSDGPPPDFGAAVERFATAAEQLRAAVAWHEGRAAEHASAIREAKAALARHGVRGAIKTRRQEVSANGRTGVGGQSP